MPHAGKFHRVLLTSRSRTPARYILVLELSTICHHYLLKPEGKVDGKTIVAIKLSGTILPVWGRCGAVSNLQACGPCVSFILLSQSDEIW